MPSTRIEAVKRIAVSDTGIGMTPDGVAEALEVFDPIDSRLACEAYGTGLGLPVVKALAEAHGLRLEVRSTPSVGARRVGVLAASRMSRPQLQNRPDYTKV